MPPIRAYKVSWINVKLSAPLSEVVDEWRSVDINLVTTHPMQQEGE